MPTSRTKLPKVTQYVKNVGKSIAFASIEGVKDNMPGMKSFSQANKETIRDIYGSIKNYRETLKNVDRNLRDTNLYKAIEYGTKNFLEDVKTGNFYNKQRLADDNDMILGIEDDDTDFNFSFNDSESSGSNAAKATLAAMDNSIGAFTTGTTTAVARGTDILVKSNKASTSFIASQIEQSTATLHTGLGSLYNSVNKVNAFLNGPMMAHLENSKKYYESSLKIMQDQQAMMREILEMQRNLYQAQSNRYSTNKLDEIMEYTGMPNLKAYGSNVKKNVMNTLDMYGISSLIGAGGDSTGLMTFASMPTALIMDAMIGTLTPKSLKRNMQMLDKAFSSLFANFIAKMNKNKSSGSELGYILGSIFGVDIKRKDSIDTSKYNKGAVPFDGITRKTIVEVIPGYLARIESALTGRDERHYDPHRGVWKSARTIERDFNTERNKHIQSANYEIESDLRDYKKKLSPKDAASLEKSLQIMMTRIFEDGGVFEPGISSSGKRDRYGRAKRTVSGDAWKKYGYKSKAQFEAALSEMNNRADQNENAWKRYGFKSKAQFESRLREMNEAKRTASDGGAWKKYGFKSKAQFEAVLSEMSDSTFYGLAGNNMRERQRWARTLEEYEKNGGPYNLMFNGAYDSTGNGSKNKMSPSLFKNNLLTNAIDNTGRTIFDYLRDISDSIRNRRRRKPTKNKQSQSNNQSSKGSGSSARESETASNDDGDPDPDDDSDDEAWRRAHEERRKEEEHDNRRTFSEWVRDKLEGTPIGKSLGKYMDAMGKIFAAPIKFTDKLLQKANDNLFAMMFGDSKEMKDKTGKRITNVFEYIIARIKESFSELNRWIKSKLNNVVKPIYDKYGRPVVEKTISMGKAAYHRVGKALNNTIFGKLRNGDVVSADEVEDAAKTYTDDDGLEYGSTLLSARGRVVTKRGLTMISPGEIIIPSTFDKREQKRLLALEKRDRSRILRHIGLNAEGTVSNTDELKRNLTKIYNENKGTDNSSKNIASGILGAGAGILTGINPLLAAAAGAGLSILDNSETLKTMVFGKVTDAKTGERDGGLVPKNIQDAYKKYMPDMADYGITGGVLGLLTPFGPLGGAAIGAGIGFLKNSDTFKKFMFGDETIGEDGLISKESWEKFKGFTKKAAPNTLIGAGASIILGGPFGILGNAALGAGLGMLSTTDSFKKFMFDKDNGVLSAFTNGVIIPAKEKFAELLADFKEYAKKNIFEPMKNFLQPFSQALKNAVTGIGEFIGDKINDSFEKLIGLPLHDFMQEKIFRPVTKLVFGILKAPIAVGKAVVAAPFRALGFIGNNMRAKQIRKGTAYNMSASERLAWRDQHKVRFNPFNRFRDKSREQDLALSNMSEAELEDLAVASKATLSSHASLQQSLGDAKKDLSGSISSFFNKDGAARFRKVKYSDVNQLVELAQSGFAPAVDSAINNMNLSQEEKDELRGIVTSKMKSVNTASATLKAAGRTGKDIDASLSKLLGHKVKGRSDRRKIYKNAEAELKARSSPSTKKELSDETNAIDGLSKILVGKSDTAIDKLQTISDYLKKIAYPNAKDTSTPDTKTKGRTNVENKTDDADTTSTEEAAKIETAAKTEEKKKKSLLSRVSSGAKGLASKIKSAILPGSNMNDDSKEAVEAANEEAAQRQNDVENTESNKKSVGLLTKIKDALVGKEETKKGGFIEWMKEKFGSVMKFIGIGALGFAAVPLLGYASEWLKVSVWPKLKNFLFGEKDSEGNVTKEGFVGKLGDKISILLHGQDGTGGIIGGLKKIAFGEDGTGGVVGSIKGFLFGDANGKEGLIPKITSAISGTIDRLSNWIEKKGGINGLLIDGFEFLVRGTTLAISNIGAPLVTILIKNLPTLLWKSAVAIYEGVKAAFKDDPPPQSTTTAMTDDGVGDKINAAMNSANSTIISGDKTPDKRLSKLNSSFSGLYKSLFGSSSKSTASTHTSKSGNTHGGGGGSLDLDNGYYKKAPGISGLLGAKVKTNKVEYDENGNIITDYTKLNRDESLASATYNAAKKSFLNGVAGMQATTLKSGIGDMAKGAGNMLLPGIGRKAKGLAQIGKGTAKAARGVTQVTQLAGNAINSGIQKIGKATVKEAAEETTKKGIISGIKNFFRELATNEGIISKFVEAAKWLTKTTPTAAKISKSLLSIADDIGKGAVKKIAKKSLTSLATAVVGVTPLTILFRIADFISGYNNAYTILGVAKNGDYNITLGHKCICGLINLILGCIPFLSIVLPTDTIVGICLNHFDDIFHFDKGLLEAREKSTEYINKWNMDPAHADRQVNSIEDLNREIDKDNSIWTKMKNSITPPPATSVTSGNPSRSSGGGGGFGRSDSPVLSGKGHIYQSGGLANMPYGYSTIGEAGCAPVAAANILNGLGRSNTSSVMDAARYAERNGMITPDGGTDISYFNSYLGSKGIPTKNTNSPTSVMNALRNGKQVVMLGQDKANGRSAPFGTEPHYVTAKGISRSGNIIAEDPDLPNSSYEYRPSKVMNSMISSVIADVKHRRKGKGRIIRSGRAARINTVAINDGGSTSLGAQAIVNIAKSQERTSSRPVNKVKYNSAFYGKEVSGSQYGWNVVFVWWCFNQAGAANLTLKTSSAPNMMTYYKNKGRYEAAAKATPKVGDIIFFKKSQSSTAPDKCAIVVGVGNTLTVIQGSYNRGVEVAHRYVRRNDKTILGFAHPAYPYIYSSAGVVDMRKWGDSTNYKNIARGITNKLDLGNNSSINNDSNIDTDDGISSEVPDVSYEDEEGTSTGTTESAVEEEVKKAATEKTGLFSAMLKLGESIGRYLYGNAYNIIGGKEEEEVTESDATESGDSESGSSESTSNSEIDYTNPGGVISSIYDVKGIHDALKAKGFSEAGVAGIMGNMNCESGYKSNNVQNSFEHKVGSDEQYTNAVNNKSYSENKFVNDKVGYGLVQSTWGPLKQSLYNHTVRKGIGIGDTQGQINALATQLTNSYPSLNKFLKTTNSVVDASDKFLKMYENPDNPGATIDKRRNYSWQAYNTFNKSGKGRADTGSSTRMMNDVTYRQPVPVTRISSSGKARSSSGSDVVYGYNYIAFLKTIIEILTNVASNTAVLYKVLDLLSEKLDLKVDAEAVKSGERTKIMNSMLSGMTDSSSKAKILNGMNTDVLLSAMAAIAAE